MEVEEVEEGEEVEDVEDEGSAAGSRLARKVASFGMRAGRYYTPGRIQSEAFSKTAERSFLAPSFSLGVGIRFIRFSLFRNIRFIFPN
jgi:hypothetical protein